MQFHVHAEELASADDPIVIATEDGIEVIHQCKQNQCFMCSGHIDYPRNLRSPIDHAKFVQKVKEPLYLVEMC
ncbi:hypothetical protein [Cytobacillus gottheilii]|uniref:hypothetical protein n=1 Tax=Cytobacillus gottheilii TaxID=859144 RepID=UPI0009B9983F|nr:hypothetical protein [Cytobacillus gottheilii]